MRLVVTAPDPVHARFRGQSTRQMLATVRRLRPVSAAADVHALSTLKAIAPLFVGVPDGDGQQPPSWGEGPRRRVSGALLPIMTRGAGVPAPCIGYTMPINSSGCVGCAFRPE